MTGSVQAMMGGGGGSPIVISLSTGLLYKAASTSTIITGSVSATITGGSGTYTSTIWTLIDGSGITATSPNTPSTAFQKTATTPDTEYFDTARLTVTDSLGGTAISADVAIDIYRNIIK